jgi:hypothetical protein
MRLLQRFLTEDSPRLQQFAEITAEPWQALATSR